jgi:hypothetical protein
MNEDSESKSQVHKVSTPRHLLQPHTAKPVSIRCHDPLHIRLFTSQKHLTGRWYKKLKTTTLIPA